MNKTLNLSSTKGTQIWVYRVVHGTRLSVVAILLLFLSFLVQPFHQAYAQEALNLETEIEEVDVANFASDVRDQQSDTTANTEMVEESEETTSATEVPDSDELVPSLAADLGDVSTAPISPTDTFESTIDVTGTSTTTTPVTPTNSNNSNAVTGSTGAATTTNTGVVTPVSTTTSTTTNPGTNINSDNSDTNENTDPSENTDNQEINSNSGGSDEPQDTVDTNDTDQTENSSDQVELDDRVVEARSVTTNDNFYQFSRQSCVAVGDGTYHCSINTDEKIDANSTVYAAIGESKTSEIFLRTKRGEVIQVTDNDTEDTAPFYDPESLQVVWQRAIGGRQQIISYDIISQKETQLTFSRTNNMEPKVSEAGIVWQAWDGNDWEVMYFDGDYTEQITDNLAQDVTPVIEDGYVLWTVLGEKEQKARVYSIADKEILTIEGHDGGAIANPRFILVYDTLFDNGDVVTKGFDPVTGLSAPIAAKPAPAPLEIPTPDPIGEIIALVQNKSSNEDDLLDVETDDPALKTVSGGFDSNVLDLSSSTPSSRPSVTPRALTEFDLILTSVDSVDDDVSTTTGTSTQE